jgi:DNA-binding response OmpR family regulator
VNHFPGHEAPTELGSTPSVPLAGEFGMLCSAREDQLRGVAGTILFVEDEIFVREVVGEILRSAGYYVLRARSSEEAVGAYKECDGNVDLLLTDVVLPGESGHILANKLRREDPAIKILFITGYVEQMGKRGAGITEECLLKPFSVHALLQRVRSVLGKTGMQRKSGNVFKPVAGNE